MTWLLAQDIPGSGFERPDLPPGVWKLALLAALFYGGRLLWQTGVLDPGHLRSPLRRHRLRRHAYGVAARVFSMEPVYGASKDRAARRAIERAHQRQAVKQLERTGRYCVYAEIHYKRGLDTGEGSKLRGQFERVWEQEMTRPDADGNPAHAWQYKWFTGSPVVLCRIAPLPAPEVVRLFGLLAPTFKWPEGTRPAEVIHASADKETA